MAPLGLKKQNGRRVAAEHGRNGFVAVAFANCNRNGVLALKSAPDRRMAAKRGFPAGVLQVAHDELRGNGGHVFRGVVFSLATVKPERESNRLARSRGSAGVSLSASGIARG